MHVKAYIKHVELENDYGHCTEGVQATCSRCEHVTESFGSSDVSVRRCLALSREECPKGERNSYVGEEE
jgi:hypothetical protein